MNFIKRGDKVNVYWENIQAEHSLTVIALPECSGDYYICQREDGSVVNIGTFCKMEQVK